MRQNKADYRVVDFCFIFSFGVTVFIFAYDPFVAKKFDHLIDMHLMIWNSWKWKPKKVRKRILPSRLSSASLQHGRHIEKMRNLNDRASGFHHYGLHWVIYRVVEEIVKGCNLLTEEEAEAHR